MKPALLTDEEGNEHPLFYLPEVDRVGVRRVDDEHLELSFWTVDGRVYVADLTRATTQVLVGMLMDKVVGTDD